MDKNCFVVGYLKQGSSNVCFVRNLYIYTVDDRKNYEEGKHFDTYEKAKKFCECVKDYSDDNYSTAKVYEVKTIIEEYKEEPKKEE